MEPMTIFAIAAGVLSTAMVYVAMKVSHFGASQALADQLLKAEAKVATAQKTLEGYTHYAKCLEASRQSAAEALRAPVLKLSREYTQVESLPMGQFKLKADATVVIRYAVEFAFALDVSQAGLALSELSNGVGLKIVRPSLLGEPKIKTLSSQVICSQDVPNSQEVLAELQAQFAPQAWAYGNIMTGDESVRNLCKLKAIDAVRDALAAQTGVHHVPAIFV